ncbi:MAG: NAD(P)-dependent oxidoreductase, partial [Cytophagaceae bacterium]|nr:NAD(P)-dependent oxidoreductase [Cytophagaceae bacterium]
MATDSHPILITGASGFLGRALVERLLTMQQRIVCLGRNRSEIIVEWLNAHPTQLEWIETPDGYVPAGALDRRTFRSVVHLASFVPSSGGENRWENVRQIQRGMVDTTISLLEAVAGKTAHLVLASSVAVYGRGYSGLLDERTLPEPTDPYGLFKLASEGICRLFAQQEAIPCALLRPTQLYGSGEPHGIFLQKFFIPAALNGQPIRLVKGGREVKDLLWIDDAAEVFLAVIQQRAEGVFNVSSGRGVTVRKLAEIVRDLTGNQSPIEVSDDGSGVANQVFSNEKVLH